jgi:hypothetical protein
MHLKARHIPGPLLQPLPWTLMWSVRRGKGLPEAPRSLLRLRLALGSEAALGMVMSGSCLVTWRPRLRN